MRTFKIGDNVKFLNQTGGGVVSAILSPQMVSVRTTDGFDLPTATNELVLVSDDRASQMFSPPNLNDIAVATVSSTKQPQESFPLLEQERMTANKPLHGKNTVEEGVYLMFVPRNQQVLVVGEIDVYLINHTSYDLLYAISLANKKNAFYGCDYGSLYAKSKVWIDSIGREDLTSWSHGIVQLIFFSEIPGAIVNPVIEEYRIRESRFYKPEMYLLEPLLGERAVGNPISRASQWTIAPQDAMRHAKLEDIPVKKEQKKWLDTESILGKHLLSREFAEIDLHIDSLVEDSTGMEPAKMLQTQLQYFEDCFHEAITHHLTKLVVIHGVGNGVLKREIEMKLKQYRGVHYFPASMEKYGVGATEVLLGSNVSERT